MFAEFYDIESLLATVEEDKLCEGMGAAMRNRYPIRFVLFDSFRDSYMFVDRLNKDKHMTIKDAAKWLGEEQPDKMPTSFFLAKCIGQLMRETSADFIFTSFSEIARFYNNDDDKNDKERIPEFKAIVGTLKTEEPLGAGFASHQRVYIPLIGLEEKMMAFRDDPNITIWHLRSESKDYVLTLTDGQTYGVGGLESRFRIISNVREWLQYWKKGNHEAEGGELLLCTSPAIFANSHNARPDNAFKYEVCKNVEEFLSKGLKFGTDNIPFDKASLEMWNRLAADIDISRQTSFAQYAEELLGVRTDMNDVDFLSAWFGKAAESDGGFRRWVLCRYYESHSDGFLASALKNLTAFDDNMLCHTIAMMPLPTDGDNSRTRCLNLLKDNGATLGDDDAREVVRRIENFAVYNGGDHNAIIHVSQLSWQEQLLALKWFANGRITDNEVQNVFPDLASYLAPTSISEELGEEASWLTDYIDKYKRARLTASSFYGQDGDISEEQKQKITGEVETVIKEKNKDVSSFSKWYNEFKTTATILHNRNDIDAYFWIDGLGIDWIPFVKSVVKSYEQKGFYLNEVHVASAKLPSVTRVNKEELQRLSKTIAENKVGDLDTMAHSHKSSDRPRLMEEMVAVRQAVEKALNKHAGKKIALLSDHGMTYMSQFYSGQGLDLCDDHHGRTATCTSGNATPSNDYMSPVGLPETVCALRHASLCAKVPKGEGAHGGCTPEECLVPIFIISPRKSGKMWSASLLEEHEDIGNNPVVRFRIKGLTPGTAPVLTYNGKQYGVKCTGEIYESDPLKLDNDCRNVVISIDGERQELYIDFTLGAQEDELFGDF